MPLSSSLKRRPSSFEFIDKALLKSLISVAIPVTVQTVLFSSKGVIDVIMLGQLTEFDVAAAGIASKILFVLTIILSGIATGGAMLAAQHFGANDENGIKRSIGLTWFVSSLVILVTLLLLFYFAPFIVQLASQESDIIALANTYLHYAAPSLFFMTYQSSIAAGLRSIHQASTATVFSAIGIALNIAFNWVLIFGLFGLPALGVKGAAIGTTLAAICETILLLLYLKFRRHLLDLNLYEVITSLDIKQLKHFGQLTIPTTCNFLLWALGVFTYTAIMGSTSTQGLVVLTIISPIEAFSLSFLTGIANASAVVVGNNLGAKDYRRAYYQSIFFVLIALACNALVALLLYWNMTNILPWFSALSPDTIELAQSFYLILCFGIVVRSLPTIMVVGVLRSGGDVKFCLYQDLLTQWLFGIPIAAICAIWLKLPPDIIFIVFFLEAVFKWISCLYRFKSKKWMNNLLSESKL